MTRVLHLIDSSGFYGAERVVLTLLHSLRGTLIDGVLGCIRDNPVMIPAISDEARGRGIPVEMFTMRGGLDLPGITEIVRYAVRNDVRIIHSHGYKPNILLSLVPHRGIRVFATVHGWAKQSAGFKVRTYEYFDCLALRRTDKAIAVSKAVSGNLSRCGLKADSVSVIYNGIELIPREMDSFRRLGRRNYELSNSTFVFGAVGRLASVKGYEFLIDAMASIGGKLHDWKLLIAGDGPLKGELIRRIARSGLSSNIIMVGYQKTIYEFLSVLDGFVMPSLSEGLPLALLEAMSVGKPIVATSVGGIPEVITNGKHGLLVPPGESNALASAILAIFQDRQLRQTFCRHATELIEERFSAERMARQYQSLYLG